MRSMNIKRITAAAVGTAMVTSALSAGLAVNTQGDVTSFVQNVKANLNDVEVVVGTNGADISDGVQAAKLAAVLATLNYEEAEGVEMMPDTTGVALGDKTVKVSTSGSGVSVTPTAENFPIVYPNTNPYGSSYAYQSDARTAIITPDSLPGVLSRTSIEVDQSGTTVEKTFEERVEIDSSATVNYAEETDPDGHGLYFDLGGTEKLHYKVVFDVDGTGLWRGSGNYSEVPEITILGHTYGIDTDELEDGNFVLYSGEKVTLSSGDEYESSNGYTVKINLITESGEVSLTVTSPEGSTKTKKLTEVGGGGTSSYNFFDEEVSVTVESAAAGFTEQNVQTGVCTLRIGTGNLEFEQGSAFPLDENWMVTTVSMTSDYLKYIDITYGKDSDDAFEEGDFMGTVKKGLALGTVVPGPKNADGDTLFDIQLVGFGGTSTVDTTPVTFELSGTGPEAAMYATWVDPDGLQQTYTPDTDKLVDLSGLTPANDEKVVVPKRGMLVINDKVVYFKEWRTSGENYIPVFVVGGEQGVEVEGTPVARTASTMQTGTFSYGTYNTLNGDAINCTYDVVPTNKDNINITYDAPNRYVTGYGCDVYPNAIQVGAETRIDSNKADPITMNLVYATGATVAHNVTTSVDGAKFPIALLWEQYDGSTALPYLDSPWLVFGDNATETYGFSADYSGLVVGYGSNMTIYNSTVTGYPDVNMSGFTKVIDTPTNKGSSTSNTVENMNHISAYGTEMEGDDMDVSFQVPEAARTAVVKVAKTLDEVETEEGTAMYTLSEGETITGVSIEEISAEITGLDSISCGAADGMVYTKASAMDPTAIVTTDSAARATYQIVVGGPFVNKIAQAIDSEGLTTTGSGAQYLIASDDGMKLLAAGYTASDSVSAINELINLLQG